MCIRDSAREAAEDAAKHAEDAAENAAAAADDAADAAPLGACLLYTSDAADERSSVDLGGRRIIKKKNEHDLGGGKNYRHSPTTPTQRTTSNKNTEEKDDR